MKNSLRRFLYALLIAIFISGNLFQGISAGSQPDNPTPEIGHNPETGRVSFIGGGSPITIPGASGIRALSAQDKAQVAAEIYGPQFGLKNPSQELTLNKTTNDGNGHAITRYQQVYQGIPVLGGELIFNMNSNGDLLSASGEVSSDLSLDTQPAISGEAAAKSALGAVAKWYKLDASLLTLSRPELMIFDESLLKESSLIPQLVWHLEVTAAGQPIREMVLIDAQTGSISLHINQIDTEGAAEPSDVETPTPAPAPTATPMPAGKPKEDSPKPSRNPSIGAGTWYVSTTGNDSNSCSATGSPCATINGALAKAAAGDGIKVAVGTYFYTAPGNPNVVTITKAIILSGGWDETFASQGGFSTIDGQNTNNGILLLNAGAVYIDSFIIQNSLTHSNSGGIYQSGGTLTLQNSTLKSNHADGWGGGIFLTDSGDLTVLNSTLSGNSAGNGGGGIYVSSGQLAIEYSTIAYNSSTSGIGAGGGVRQVAGLIWINNSILAHNTATVSGPDCSGTIGASDHNILGNTTGCTIPAGTGDQFNVDPLIDALAGTPPMHALQPGSPAINAGYNSLCPGMDERWVTRPQGSACDIGAYEYNTPGDASAIGVSSGSPQIAAISTAFGSPLKAFVTDQYGLPVGSITVTFTGPSSGAGGTFADSGNNLTTAVTDSSGIATAAIFTANATAGGYTVDATASGIASTAHFQLTNSGNVQYVSTAGNDSNDCQTPAAPCATINGAIGKASSGNIINVAGGTYTGTGSSVVDIAKSIQILGGWDAAFTARNGQSIIDGQAARMGINIHGTGLTVELSQVMVQNSGYWAVPAIYDNNVGGTVNFNRMAIINNRGNGISNNTGNINITNSTIGGNYTHVNPGSAIRNVDGHINIQFSTIANNTTDIGGYAIESYLSSQVEIGNSILRNTSGNCTGNVTSDGHNIFSISPACQNAITVQPGDQVGVNPQIGPLTSGGYQPLLPGSPAIDAADPLTCPAVDQRGDIRPSGAGCDIGAYEVVPPGPAAAVSAAGGSGQVTGLNQPLLLPLLALVVDSYGTPVSGATVTFTAPSSGASGTFTGSGTNTITALTNSSGIATAPAFTANSIAGAYNITASTAGAAVTASFSITNQDYYVSPSGSDSADCLTPSTACLTINGAIARAPSGAGIRLAGGTYTGSGSYVVTISKSIHILGGWNGAFTTQNGRSIIDGQASRTEIYINGTGLTVDLSQVTVQNGGGYSSGFGVYNNNPGGIVNLNRVGIINNNGNGISNYRGTINITNSTISGNHITDSSGSAINNWSGYADNNINIQYSTITNNSGQPIDSGAGDYAIRAGPRVEIGNTILAGNTPGDCTGNIVSDGHNIFGRSPACHNAITTQPSDQVGIDPQMSSLTAGGYHPLASSSPAVNAADTAACPAADQRGTPRPYGAGCDIGAYEYIPAGPAATISVVSGSGQGIGFNLPLTAPLSAFVADSNGVPVSGASVTFTGPASGAGGTFSDSGTNTTTSLTNNLGIATSAIFTSNAVAGSYNITASTPGVAGTVSFSITNQQFYVAPTGSDSADCLTPGTACLTINGAIAKASSGAGIDIAAGTYTGTGNYVVTISKSIHLLGGWDAAFAAQNGQSIIDDQAARSGIYITGTNLAVELSQLRVQNGYGSGYGIYNENPGGTVNLTRVTLINNSGTGIQNYKGNLNITNSTISGNGYINLNNLNGNINIQFSTIISNSPNYTIFGTTTGTHIEMGNSILAGNDKGDCYANIISDGHNIFGHFPACYNAITTQPSDQVGVNPRVDPLTPAGYYALSLYSPAIDAGSPTCTGTDQRGVSRPQGSACDIGAYEYRPGTIPASMTIIQGSPQDVRAGNAAPTQFEVLVTDAVGAGVPGLTVTFTAPSSGASGVFSDTGTNSTTVVTGFTGFATASTFTTNATYGTYPIPASVSGLSTPADFLISNHPPFDILTYTMNHNGDENALPGAFVCFWGPPTCTGGTDADINHATLYAYDTYDFYQTHFNRNSINDGGMAIISSVHFGTNYQNAFWNGSQMVYGDGFTADDVVGHELTHGVTDYESQLIYIYQSGTINESLSDVFGEFIDQTDGAGNDSAAVKWLLGEDLPGGASRNMSNPPAKGDPDRMTSPNYYYGVGDNGGVHRNSGVNNKAAFLMTDGGSFNGRVVSGIGLNKTAAIYYEVQTNLLGAGANYSDLYYAIRQACFNLVDGSDGITAGDCEQVKNAVEAVEMNIKLNQAYAPYPDACAAGQNVTSTLFSDDMENGTGKWNFAAYLGNSAWDFRSPGIASPDHSMWSLDIPYITDSFAAMASDITVPAGSTMLYFKHYFELDSYYDANGKFMYAYDGGVVEYSTDHGATWNDAGPLFNAGQNYTAILQRDYGNPLGRRWAFSGFSDRMVGSRYNLSGLAGKTVRFRWRVGTDNSYGFAGWLVDDVKVYTCANVSLPVISGNAGIAGATLTYTDGGIKTAVADGAGNYSFMVSYNWSGTVTPSWNDYLFYPRNRTYNHVVTNQTGQNYLPAESISGNAGAAGVTLSYTDGTPKTATSLADGSYSLMVSHNWNGTITPSHACYTFDPVNVGYSNVIADLTAQDYSPTINTGCADINVSIGGNHQGTYGLPSAGSMRVNYAGVDSGPLKVMSTNSVPIIAAVRDALSANGTTTSFAQLMGLPASQLSDTYVFPAYNNVTLNEQLRIGNVDTVPTTVTVTIGGVLRGTYPLAASQAVRVNYAGLDSGPVIVQGTPGVHIIAAERDAWAAGAPYNTTTSFVQLMGLPASQLSDTYVFPAYNNVTLNEQLRIGNVDSVPTTVTVTIGGVLQGTYPLDANTSVRVNYAGLDSGPVIVQGTAGVHIIAAIRDAWAANGVTTSYAQLMGLPAGQLSDTFLFPAYNNVTLNEQLRIGNVDSVPTTVTVTIGGVLQGTYPLDANTSVRVNYAGLDSGPVVVQGTSGVHIIAAVRDALAANGVTTSFVQLMGLPFGQLSDTYLFPAYNNVTLNEQLRFGVP